VLAHDTVAIENNLVAPGTSHDPLAATDAHWLLALVSDRDIVPECEWAIGRGIGIRQECDRINRDLDGGAFDQRL